MTMDEAEKYVQELTEQIERINEESKKVSAETGELHEINTKKLLEIEKEMIVREVVRGDKHNLRKSANRNPQISVIHSAHCNNLCFAICRFSQVVFVTSNNFTQNLLFYLK